MAFYIKDRYTKITLIVALFFPWISAWPADRSALQDWSTVSTELFGDPIYGITGALSFDTRFGGESPPNTAGGFVILVRHKSSTNFTFIDIAPYLKISQDGLVTRITNSPNALFNLGYFPRDMFVTNEADVKPLIYVRSISMQLNGHDFFRANVHPKVFQIHGEFPYVPQVIKVDLVLNKGAVQSIKTRNPLNKLLNVTDYDLRMQPLDYKPWTTFQRGLATSTEQATIAVPSIWVGGGLDDPHAWLACVSSRKLGAITKLTFGLTKPVNNERIGLELVNVEYSQPIYRVFMGVKFIPTLGGSNTYALTCQTAGGGQLSAVAM